LYSALKQDKYDQQSSTLLIIIIIIIIERKNNNSESGTPNSVYFNIELGDIYMAQ